jgi:hypothetical protein
MKGVSRLRRVARSVSTGILAPAKRAPIMTAMHPVTKTPTLAILGRAVHLARIAAHFAPILESRPRSDT